jgi:cytochrome c biogenesis protein CcmG/thiol:disulfide interchange protein DsbE
MLAKLGNPYKFNMLDENRSYSFDLGVTGAPETFMIDKQGRVRLHHIGDLNQRVWQSKFALLYSQLEAE